MLIDVFVDDRLLWDIVCMLWFFLIVVLVIVFLMLWFVLIIRMDVMLIMFLILESCVFGFYCLWCMKFLGCVCFGCVICWMCVFSLFEIV